MDINAGTEWEREIDKHFNTSQIILLLISPDFLASDYAYSKELMKAMQRHEAGGAYVIPIIVRPVAWQEAPFGKLQALPRDGTPITRWGNMDEAFLSVVEGIRVVCQELLAASLIF
jgi:TIR domain-containing protein